MNDVPDTDPAAYDVIVVGAGAAGCTAALTAHDAGARVLLVDSQDRFGGSTALSGGYMFAAGTDVQRAAGVLDDAEAMLAYLLQVDHWQIERAIAERLCVDSAWAVAWLTSLGVTFRADDLVRTGMETVRRGHRADGGGAAIAAALEHACVQAPGVDVALGNTVDHLIVEGGRVAGVVARGEEALAAAVVIASGGFGQNPELVRAHFPAAAAAGTWAWSVAAPGSVGSAIVLGAQAGAAFTGDGRGLAVPVPSVVRTTTTRSSWMTLIDRDGERFIAEDAYHSVLAAAIHRRGGMCFAIFDEARRRAAPEDPAYGGLLGNDRDVDLAGYPPTVRRANHLDGLAAAIDVDPATFARTIDEVAVASSTGVDHRFGKSPALLRPIEEPPFYAVEIRPALIALTGYGLRIDDRARVLDVHGEPIPGLLAAGEATGSVSTQLYVGSGSSITSCVVFGRQAGLGAAAAAGRTGGAAA